jgi:plastocyanin
LNKTPDKKPPFAVWMICAGLIFAGLDLLYGISSDLANPAFFDPFVGVIAAFVVLCFVASLGTFMQKRWGFVLAIVVSLGFAVPSLFVFIPTLSNPFNFATFVIASSSVPVLFLVALFSLLCLLNRKKGLYQKKYLASPYSAGGIIAAIVLLIVIGIISFGAYSVASDKAPTTETLITIIPGASDPSNPAGHFSLTVTTVVIGMNNTVTWVNDDHTIHTITSDGGIFSSGLLNDGNKWSYTFTTAGTYGYHCEIHPFMTGTIVVKS